MNSKTNNFQTLLNFLERLFIDLNNISKDVQMHPIPAADGVEVMKAF